MPAIRLGLVYRMAAGTGLVTAFRMGSAELLGAVIEGGTAILADAGAGTGHDGPAVLELQVHH
jgi:hypothetical protein